MMSRSSDNCGSRAQSWWTCRFPFSSSGLQWLSLLARLFSRVAFQLTWPSEEVGINEPRALGIGLAKVNVAQVRFAEVRAVQGRVADIGTREDRTMQVRVGEVGVRQDRRAQIHVAENRGPQRGSVKVGVAEAGPIENGSGKVGIAEQRLGEVCLAEICIIE